jgi:hypothetical protein
MFSAKAASDNKCYMLVTTTECPQSVQTSFMPATVFSRTSWTVFEWHFVHSLDTVSGLGMLARCTGIGKFNLSNRMLLPQL